ncbi:unnamed protein product [Sphenostylis stenocarpa]|uniref:Uncharacterized protein n=1 Tax=Sphenostylis stenocarpa TaxID=92480 RepID=A0AA86VBJ0_9FABA|nr:unnamed protein product [Sphenostylis stenocarpa]
MLRRVNRRGDGGVVVDSRTDVSSEFVQRGGELGEFSGARVRRKFGCLMLMYGGDDTELSGGPGATLGNYQQQGFEVVFDLENQRVDFAKRQCASLWNTLNREKRVVVRGREREARCWGGATVMVALSEVDGGEGSWMVALHSCIQTQGILPTSKGENAAAKKGTGTIKNLVPSTNALLGLEGTESSDADEGDGVGDGEEGEGAEGEGDDVLDGPGLGLWEGVGVGEVVGDVWGGRVEEGVGAGEGA